MSTLELTCAFPRTRAGAGSLEIGIRWNSNDGRLAAGVGLANDALGRGFRMKRVHIPVTEEWMGLWYWCWCWCYYGNSGKGWRRRVIEIIHRRGTGGVGAGERGGEGEEGSGVGVVGGGWVGHVVVVGVGEVCWGVWGDVLL